jgi:chaperonin GroEL (HSP60 family)
VKTADEDQKHGVEIVKKTITSPARQIAINSGEDGSVVVGKILENETYGYGSTPKPASSAISSPRESSTRPRWFASRCKMGHQSRAF